jgi:formiminotetrahydrofolate cyclodeaminase
MVVSLSANDDEASAALGTTFSDLEALRDALLAASEADERAYGGYIRATKLPKQSDEEKAARREAVQSALRRSAEAPMQIAENAMEVLQLLRPVARHGNRHIWSRSGRPGKCSSECADDQGLRGRVIIGIEC